MIVLKLRDKIKSLMLFIGVFKGIIYKYYLVQLNRSWEDKKTIQK